MNQEIKLNRYYQHRDGGLYYTEYISTSTVDKSVSVVYHHVYPFEYKTWHKPIQEWTDERFKMLTLEEAKIILNKDQQKFMEEILSNKHQRKLNEETSNKA